MILSILMFLAWGSYLNSLGYRLLHLNSFFQRRSFCPSCKKIIAWYDNLPIVSWFNLRGQCRSCKQPISWLYPFIEIISTLLFALLYNYTEAHYFPAYFIFFSALIVTIRTDLDQMLISRYVTLYLVPIAYLATVYNQLPLSCSMAIIGSLFGYFLLWCAKTISKALLGQDGMGQGDLELLAMIGAFTGPLGCWVALTIGSFLGTIITLIIMAIRQQRIVKIPFGPYLAAGAIFFVLLQPACISYFSI
ncbi:prepilin peptidase [Candidatus Chromulinivorax destructor]|nr:A24 family peptidase [Candidatus Chromulinivorax destructor]